MIFYDIFSEDKLKVGTKCKIYGPVKECGDIVIIEYIRRHRYCVVDNNAVSWTKNGFLYQDKDASFLKDIILMKVPRIISI